jgi:hypothetical protein
MQSLLPCVKVTLTSINANRFPAILCFAYLASTDGASRVTAPILINSPHTTPVRLLQMQEQALEDQGGGQSIA